MEEIKYMQCMEVWGGNRLVDSGVIMPGVDAWVFSQPCENQPAGGDVHYVSTCCGGKVVRMLRIVSGIGNVNASQLIPSLLAEIAKSDPAYGARDDVTCLAFRPNGLRPSIPIRDLILAPFRMMLAVAGLKFGYAGWKRKPWDAPIGSSAE